MCCFFTFALAAMLLVGAVIISVSAGVGATGLSALAFQWRFLQQRRRAGPPLSLWGLLRIYALETRATIVLAWWHVRARLAATETPGDGPTVILVHGYTQNSTNMWGLRNALLQRGRASQRISLGAPLPWRRLDFYGRVLTQELEARPGGVAVIAHSMGGLVLRQVLLARPDLRTRVRAVVTLGTPHRGTAVHPRVLDVIKPADQMSPEARWFRELATLPELLPHARITTIGSWADMIVYPESSTRQEGAPHIGFDDIGHGGLLTDARSIQAAVDAISR